MYLPGEALTGIADINPLADTVIYDVKTPGLIARNSRSLLFGPEMPATNEDLAKVLFKLTEYGIDFPGIGTLLTPAEGCGAYAYAHTTTHRVDGFNMHRQMELVPLPVVEETVDNILTYYEEMSYDFSDEQYLADLSLRQCVYGREQGEGTIDDGEPHVYFVDFDPLLANCQTSIVKPVFLVPTFGGIKGLDSDLGALKENYPDRNFDEIAGRLLYLARRIGLSRKTPNAFYRVEGE